MKAAIVTSEIVSIAFLCVISVGILNQKGKERETAKLFLISVLFCIFGATTDAASFLLNGRPELHGLLLIVNVLALVSCDLTVIPFVYYVWSLADEKRRPSQWYVRAAAIGCMADIAFIIAGTLSGQLFTIENGKFREGPLYQYLGIIQIMAMFYFFAFMTSRHRLLGKRVVVAMWAYFLLPTATAIFDLTVQDASFVYVSIALVLMIVYVSLQSGELERRRMLEKVMFEASITDTLTGLKNRRAYERRLSDTPPKSPIGVLFCDLNGLKYANDNFGHSAGDALLLKFSDLLKEYFESEDIFRISGDEFVVLMQDVSAEQFEAQSGRVRKAIADSGEIASGGSAYGEGGSVLALIREAEKNMYADKSAYYSRKGYDRRK